MKQMLTCPNCKAIYSADEGYALDCSDCKIPLVPIGITKEQWSKMNSDEKHAARTEALERQGETPIAPQAEASPLEEMQKDISTIKNILVFYLVISIIGAIIILTTIAPLFR